jgi:hypothetical protein
MKTTHPIKGVTRKADVKSPLKKMHIAPVEEPETPKHNSAHGLHPGPAGAAKAKMKKTKKDGNRRPRNKGRS